MAPPRPSPARAVRLNVPPPSTGYPPPPGPFAARAFEHYVRRQARRYFAAVHWALTDEPAARDRSLPAIFVANHTNWWDGFIGYLVSRALGAGFRVLMEERNLARYRVFLRVGALPLRRTSPREARADLEVARAHLAPGVGLWVFPQGVRRPAAEPIARCERGAAHLALAADAPVQIVPVAFRYPFLGEQLPEGFVLVGTPWVVEPGTAAGRRPLMGRIEHELGATISRLDERLAAEDTAGFRLLVHGRLSVNKRMDRFRHAVGLLGGRFEARNG